MVNRLLTSGHSDAQAFSSHWNIS